MNTDTAVTVTPEQPRTLRDFVDARGTRYIFLAGMLGVAPSHMTRLLDGKRRITAAQAAILAEFYSEPGETFLTLAFVGGDE